MEEMAALVGGRGGAREGSTVKAALFGPYIITPAPRPLSEAANRASSDATNTHCSQRANKKRSARREKSLHSFHSGTRQKQEAKEI